MLRRFFGKEQTIPVDSLIDRVLERMHEVGVASEDYPKLLSYLERLHTIKANERHDPVSRDTILMVLGNLMGIILIVAYEQKHIMTSKGFSQLIRPRTP